MLDRYSQKDRDLISLGVGDLVVTVIKEDPKYPARGIGFVKSVDFEKEIKRLEEEKNHSIGIKKLLKQMVKI